MPDLLLELRSEEIPARMQRKAAGDLRKMITDGLVEAGLTYEGCQEYWTPRRLTLDIRGVTARSRDVTEERKGPSTKAPEQAIQGFLRSAGLASIAEAQVQSDPKKGDFYLARITRSGRAAEDVIAALVPQVVRTFPWPKEMRWGAGSGPKGMRYGKVEGKGGEALRWVRPLQSIVCTFGPETEEPVVVDFEVDGIRSGNVTYGHRFHAPEAITVRRFDDYVEKLAAAKVVLDAERRKEIIRADAKNIAFANGLELVEDEGLLEEVSGLVEWPVVLMGEFEADFLDIPAEVIRLTIRANQKCFVCAPTSPLRGEVAPQDAGGGVELSNRFILTSNIEAKDGGKEIAHGNGKVVRARLSDALYFWKTDQGDLPDLAQLEPSAKRLGLDLTKPLDQRMARLDHLNVTFHAKLGTQGERVERIRRLAEEISAHLPLEGGGRREASGGGDKTSPHPGGFAADPPPQGEGESRATLIRRAALLAKADLQTDMVGEFPELQGVMGRKYALLQGEHPSVAAAIEDHYKPQGPSDRVPSDPVSIAVALADKLDTLVGFWAIDEKPTGSKDPYALRRAALGVIRIILENDLSIPLRPQFAAAHAVLMEPSIGHSVERFEASQPATDGDDVDDDVVNELVVGNFERKLRVTENTAATSVADDLLIFFHDRLKVYLRDKGARYDLIDAVISHVSDDLLTIVRRVEALGTFLDTEAGKNLLAGTKRAANILAAEEKKGTAVAASVEPAKFSQEAETVLFAALNQAERQAGEAIQKEDFSGAMRALSALREPVDSFFEAVLVNDEDQSVRANRLALLARIRAATGQVADFSRIAG